MRCENCREQDAEIQLTHIEGGEMTTSHLCPTCAAEKGISSGVPATATSPLAGFVAQLGGEPEHEGAKEQALAGASDACPYCGTGASDFRKTGRLGCAHCYAHFAPQLKGLLRRIHGATQHMGKVYLSQISDLDDVSVRLATLKRRLDRAVEIEDFEAAAELRDQIHDLEVVE